MDDQKLENETVDEYRFDMQGITLHGVGTTKEKAWSDAVERLVETYKTCMPDEEHIKKDSVPNLVIKLSQ